MTSMDKLVVRLLVAENTYLRSTLKDISADKRPVRDMSPADYAEDALQMADNMTGAITQSKEIIDAMLEEEE